MDGYTISIDVNATKISATVERRRLLVHILREQAGKTGTHIGCDTSQCGACTVRKDGMAVKSCAVLAVQANGHAITTIEGLGDAAHLTPLQQAFHEKPPAEQILANLEWIARALISANDFRGCAFLNALAELGSEARELAVAYKESRRLWYRDLLSQLDVDDPDTPATQLSLLVDGAYAAVLTVDEFIRLGPTGWR